MRRSVGMGSIVTIFTIAICLFMVLPIPSTKVIKECPQTRCAGSQFVATEARRWHWFGGYHATVEGYTAKSLKETLKYEEKYGAISGTLIVVLGLVSSAMSVAIYTFGMRRVKPRVWL